MPVVNRRREKEDKIKKLINVMQQYRNGCFYKPNIQRPAYWEVHRSILNKSVPNIEEYVLFIIKTGFTKELTFSYDAKKNRYVSVDGNNRFNALMNFALEPYLIFPQYYNNLFSFIKNNLQEDDAFKVMKYFQKLDYNNLFCLNSTRCIENNEEIKEILEAMAGGMLNLLFDEIDDLKKKWLIDENGKSVNVLQEVEVRLQIFKGWENHEIIEYFIESNSKSGSMKVMDKLNANLSTIYIGDFVKKFDDSHSLFIKIIEEVVEHYNIRNASYEVMKQYKISKNEQLNHKLNGFEFLVGFSMHLSSKFPLLQIYKYNTDDKIWPLINIWMTVFKCHIGADLCVLGKNKMDRETTLIEKNVLNFTRKIMIALEFLEKSYSRIMSVEVERYSPTKKKNDTTNCKDLILSKTQFQQIAIQLYAKSDDLNDQWEQALDYVLKYHRIYKIFTSTSKFPVEIDIDGWNETILNNNWFTAKSTSKGHFHKHLSHCMRGIGPKDEKGLYIIDWVKKQSVQKNFMVMLKQCCNCDKSEVVYKEKKRRAISKFQNIMIADFIRKNTPISILEKYKKTKRQSDHLIPYSIRVKDQEISIPFSINRLGNFVPSPGKINASRGNKNLSIYDNNKDLHTQIFDLLPKKDEYNEIVEYKKGKKLIPYFKNLNAFRKFNEICDRNEKVYFDNFVNLN